MTDAVAESSARFQSRTLALTNYQKVDILGVQNESVNFPAPERLAPPNRK